MDKLTTLFFSLMAGAPMLCSGLTVDAIYQSHMVLQQGKQVPLTGTCSGSAPVMVSFGDQKVQAVVKGKKWTAVLSPMAANAEGQSLRIAQGSEEVTLDDVVVGEVWLASGQSNMLWRLDQTRDQAALNQEEIPLLRFYHSEPKVLPGGGKHYTEEVIKKLERGEMYEGSWSVSSPATCRTMSAVGWYFGRKLQQQLGVPVGIIHASLGGSEMIAWMPTPVLKKKYKECLTSAWLESKYVTEWVKKRGRMNVGNSPDSPHPFKPGYLFTTGIEPWVRFPLAGVIWYQGETDAEVQDQKQNTQLLKDLINGWRAEFKNPTLPFCMVQLPRLNDKSVLRAYWPEFREVQRKVSEKMPHVYYSVTLDLGSTNSDVHPPRKLEVGERLAALAAAKIYKKDVPYSGPTFKAATPQGKKLFIELSHAEGLTTKNGADAVGFELSENGKVFEPATVEITDGGVLLSSPKVKKPKHARYAWAVYLEPNLVNAAGLPAAPFTTVSSSKN